MRSFCKLLADRVGRRWNFRHSAISAQWISLAAGRDAHLNHCRKAQSYARKPMSPGDSNGVLTWVAP